MTDTPMPETTNRDLIDRQALLEQIDGALANFANARSWARPSAGDVLREVKRVVVAMPAAHERSNHG